MKTKKDFTIPQLIEYGKLAELTQMPGNANPPAYGAQECAAAYECKQAHGSDWAMQGS